MDFLYDNNGRPSCCIYDGTKYIYVLNQQGDVIRITNTSGTTVASYVYDAWGKIISSSGSMASINPLRYRGYYYDKDTGLYYLGSRYYDPVVKRFINADSATIPSATAGSLTDKNLYAYCDNNPVMRTDDGGEFWNLVVGAAVGGIIGGVSAAITSYKDTGSVDISSVLVGAGTGAIGGLFGATGFGAVTQAVVSGVASGANTALSSVLNGDKVDWLNVASDAGIGVVSSLVGSAVTKKAVAAAEKGLKKGIQRAITGKTKYDSGSRFWKGAAKRGLERISYYNRALNTARGKASLIGSGLGGVIGLTKYACGYLGRSR